MPLLYDHISPVYQRELILSVEYCLCFALLGSLKWISLKAILFIALRLLQSVTLSY